LAFGEPPDFGVRKFAIASGARARDASRTTVSRATDTRNREPRR
jgi:hypothetical protein